MNLLTLGLCGVAFGAVVSQTFLDFSILFLLCTLVVQQIKSKKLSISLRKPYFFEYGFICYIIVVILGLVTNHHFDYLNLSKLIKFNWIINFYILYWSITRIEFNSIQILKFFSFAFVLPNLYAVTTFVFNHNWLTRNELHESRVVGLVNSATYHAHGNALLFTFFSVIFYLNFKYLNLKLKAQATFALILFILSISLTFTRGIWISIVIVGCIFLYMNNKKHLFLALTVGCLVFSSLFKLSSVFNERINHSINTKSSDHLRWNLFKVHIEMIKDSPLLGVGHTDPLNHTAKWWPNLNLSETYYDSHAHNQFLNVFALTGILGLICFLSFYLWFLIKNIQLFFFYKKNKRNLQSYFYITIACLMVQIEFIIANFTDIGFEYTKIRILILMTWALILALDQKKIKIIDVTSSSIGR